MVISFQYSEAPYRMSTIISGFKEVCMKRVGFIVLALCFAFGCVQKFQPSIPATHTGYLVVEGIINSSGPASVTITRTNILNDSTKIFESGAAVQVEGMDNSSYSLSDKGSGIYANDSLALIAGQQYRLHIKTSDAREYLSDYSVVKITPPIDSISWQQTNAGVQLYANTHDPLNNTIYYQWDFQETWQFHSPYFSDLEYDTIRDASNNPLYDANGRPQLQISNSFNVNYAIYFCWKNAASSTVLINSTAKLSGDVVVNFPLQLISPGSDRLGIEYSMLVKQHAISSDAFNFLQILRKNTEETGSIFSSQPSQLQGNVHSITNPSETVVGYVGFSTEQSQRIFINSAQVPGWFVDSTENCSQNVYRNIPDEVLIPFSNNFLPTTPVEINFVDGKVITFNAARASCVDCRISGTNQKPSYWPQ